MCTRSTGSSTLSMARGSTLWSGQIRQGRLHKLNASIFARLAHLNPGCFFRVKLDVQARFEQVEASPYGPVAATQLTSFAAKDNISATVEIRYTLIATST